MSKAARQQTTFEGITVENLDDFEQGLFNLIKDKIPGPDHFGEPTREPPHHDRFPEQPGRLGLTDRQFGTMQLEASRMLCELARPPATIDTRTDPASGDLILKCVHAPSHRWHLSGKRIP